MITEANRKLYEAAVDAAKALRADTSVSTHETLNQVTALANEIADLSDDVVRQLREEAEAR